MDTPDFEYGRVYSKQFGAERVKADESKQNQIEGTVTSS